MTVSYAASAAVAAMSSSVTIAWQELHTGSVRGACAISAPSADLSIGCCLLEEPLDANVTPAARAGMAAPPQSGGEAGAASEVVTRQRDGWTSSGNTEGGGTAVRRASAPALLVSSPPPPRTETLLPHPRRFSRSDRLRR
eukprot:scaffold88626_cov27-Tisochrysis_lutea.AAC.4